MYTRREVAFAKEVAVVRGFVVLAARGDGGGGAGADTFARLFAVRLLSDHHRAVPVALVPHLLPRDTLPLRCAKRRYTTGVGRGESTFES